MRASLISRGSRAELAGIADEDLIGRVRDGDGRAFEVLVERHADVAFSLAYRMCGRRAMAEDVVQEVLLSLWRSSARYDRTRGSVRTWVLRVVHNRAIDVLRRDAVRAGRDVSDDDSMQRLAARESTEAEVQRRAEASQMRDALGALPAEQRQVIELAYFGGFTHREIAQMLALPAGTVKGRMRLALTKLRISVGDQAHVLQ